MPSPTRRILPLLGIALMTLLLGACASGPPRPDVDYKPDYDFSQVRSVAFYAESGTVEGDNPLQLSDMQKERIDTGIRTALQNRGLTLVDDPAQADLLVSWHLLTQFKTDVRSYDRPDFIGFYHGYNRYSLYHCWSCIGPRHDIVASNYTEGTFIVDMIDPELKRSVWRGVTHSRLSNEQVRDQQEYNEAAAAIFAAFPPGRQDPGS
jgi:hypothetical protein